MGNRHHDRDQFELAPGSHCGVQLRLVLIVCRVLGLVVVGALSVLLQWFPLWFGCFSLWFGECSTRECALPCRICRVFLSLGLRAADSHAPATRGLFINTCLAQNLQSVEFPTKLRSLSQALRSYPFLPVSTSLLRLPHIHANGSTHTQRQTHRDRDTQTHRDRDTQTHRHTDAQTHTDTHTDTHTHTHTQSLRTNRRGRLAHREGGPQCRPCAESARPLRVIVAGATRDF